MTVKRPYTLTYLVPGGHADGRDSKRAAHYATEQNARRGLASIRREQPDWIITGLWRGAVALPLDP